MASGNYPINKINHKKEYNKLKNAELDIAEVIVNVGIERSQSDNAAIDGGYREKLRLARSLILDCLEGSTCIQ